MLDVVLSSIAQMAGMFGIGWVLDRFGYLRAEDYARLSKIAVDVLLPLLIFHAIVQDLETSRLRELWMLPMLGFAIITIGCAIGYLSRWALPAKDQDRRRTFVHICAINNFGFLPIYIISHLIDSGNAPSEMLALLFVFNLGSLIGFWTVGVSTLSGGHPKEVAKKIGSPALFSIAFAIVLAHFDGRDWVPSLVLSTADAAGGISVPLMMILSGGMLRGAFRKENAWEVGFTTAVRNCVIPAICIVLASLVAIADDARFLWNVVAVMPAAATTPMMARVYGGSPQFSSAVLVVSTLAGVVTIPLGLLFAEWLS